MRALLLVAAACAALVAAAPASAGGRLVERGIVQSVGPAQVVLRALDGTETTVAIGSTTRMRLNGRPVSLTSIREGFVAEAVTAGPGPALVLRVFGRVRQEAVVGELVRILPRAVVLRRDTGGRLRVPVSGRTRVWRGGRVVSLRALRPGSHVRVVRARHGTARIVLVLEGHGA